MRNGPVHLFTASLGGIEVAGILCCPSGTGHEHEVFFPKLFPAEAMSQGQPFINLVVHVSNYMPFVIEGEPGTSCRESEDDALVQFSLRKTAPDVSNEDGCMMIRNKYLMAMQAPQPTGVRSSRSRPQG